MVFPLKIIFQSIIFMYVLYLKLLEAGSGTAAQRSTIQKHFPCGSGLRAYFTFKCLLCDFAPLNGLDVHLLQKECVVL